MMSFMHAGFFEKVYICSNSTNDVFTFRRLSRTYRGITAFFENDLKNLNYVDVIIAKSKAEIPTHISSKYQIILNDDVADSLFESISDHIYRKIKNLISTDPNDSSNASKVVVKNLRCTKNGISKHRRIDFGKLAIIGRYEFIDRIDEICRKYPYSEKFILSDKHIENTIHTDEVLTKDEMIDLLNILSSAQYKIVINDMIGEVII